LREEPYLSRARTDIIWKVSFLRGNPVSGRQRLPGDGTSYEKSRGTALQQMEETMRNQRIPEMDSIEELAAFWVTHDLTDFEDQLDEVTEPIFVRGKPFAAEPSRG
jgi:hypothetical protein